MRSGRLVVPLLLLLAPSAAGAGAGLLSLGSADDVALSGDVVVVAPNGHLRAVARDGGADGVFLDVTGTLTVWTWTAAAVRPASGALPVRERIDEARPEHYRLDNATLRWSSDGATTTLVAVAREGGAIEARGPVDSTGRPARVPGTPHDVRVLPERDGAPDDVVLGWREGWPFVGSYAAGDRWRGFPLVTGAEASFHGPLDMAFHGGEMRFVDAEGRHVAVRLDPRPEAAAGSAASVERWTRVVFRGSVNGGELAMPATWGLAAPHMGLSFTGEARWTNATGTFVTEGTRRTFERVTVEGVGGLRISSTPVPALGDANRLEYRVSGDWERVRIGGVVVESPSSVPAPVAGAWIGAALLAVLGAYVEFAHGVLGRCLAAFYVRLRPSEMLSHPLRARIHEAVKANPGIHLRRLHRQVAGAWGTFSFHLHMLEQAGHVRIRREQGFTLVFASADERHPPRAIPHPTARQIHAALPEDGASIGVARLRERAGVSRQLLDHHLRWLQSQGLVELVARKRGVERLVRRRTY